MKLPESFYQREDVLQVSRDLLGKYLFTRSGGELCGGMIVETEAYRGQHDRASHAWQGRRTARTEVMYRPGGLSYVYLCYGIHHLFNVVTAGKDVPYAVLIRAIEPLEGLSVQLARRKMREIVPRITAGPGALSQALGIDRSLNGCSLLGDEIWIEDRQSRVDPASIIARPRVGVAYAGSDALLPWRFSIRDNSYVSKAK